MIAHAAKRALPVAVLVVAGLAWAGGLRAQPPPATAAKPRPAPLSGEELARRVAPLVDEQVFLVLHADLAGVDVETAIKGLLADLAAKAPKDLMDTLTEGAAQARPVGAPWLEEFLRRGGRDVYLLISIEGIPQDWGMLVVPLGEKADANALANLLRTGRPAPAAPAQPAEPRGHGLLGDETTAVAGGLLLIGPKEMVTQAEGRLSPSGATTRPARKELLPAFQSCADMRAQALLLPSSDTRRVVEELMPQIPPQLGGGPSTAVTRGMLWAAVGVNLWPQAGLKVRVQSQDADSAAAFAAFAGRALQALAQHAPSEMPALAEALPMLTPKARGDQVTLDLSAKDVSELIQDVGLPVLIARRGSAQGAAAAANLSNIGKAIAIYSTIHKDEFPPDLQTLAREVPSARAALVNPRLPGKAVGFVYIKPAADMNKVDAGTIVAYEDFDQWGKGIWVLFADFHVGRYDGPEGQKDFARHLAAARAASQPATQPAREF